MSNTVPNGWVFGKFGDLAKVQNGFAFKSSDFSEQGYAAAIRMSNLKSGRIDVSDAKYVRQSVVDGLDQFRLAHGDFLFGMSGSLDNYAWMTESSGVCYLNQRVGCLRVKSEADPLFASYCYLSEAIKSEIVGLAAGAAQLNISGSQLEAIPVQLPPLPEQQKIAAILSSIFDLIELTRAQIDKLKDLKTSMMQELFRKGIGSGGVSHTEFKDSPVGLVPVSWDYKRFSDITIKIQDGTHFSPQSKSGEYLYLTSKNIQGGRLDLRNVSYISKEEHENIYRRCDVTYGDVLLTKDGANTGNCALNTLYEPFSLLSSVAFLRCDPTQCLNEYLYQYICSPVFQKTIKDSMTGNAITRLTLTLIKGLAIPLPSREEQEKIVAVLRSIDMRIGKLEKKQKQALYLKKAVMQDLLTGKVRVNFNQKESTVA